MPRTLLVTVGTTQFDELIRAVDDLEFLETAKRKGFTRLVIQHGNGAHRPAHLRPGTAGLDIECFDYKPTLAGEIAAADLVISHAGSGSIFEGLSAGRALIVVPNERLMHNHQRELAEQLAAMQHLVCATPSQLVAALSRFDAASLKPYTKGDPGTVAGYITAALDLKLPTPQRAVADTRTD